MGTPSSPVWYPVATLLLGFVTSAAIEWLRDMRTTRRETFKIKAERSAALADRNRAYQQNILQELQEVMFTLGRYTALAHHQDKMSFHKTGTWQHNLINEEDSVNFRLAQMRMSILSVRVQDDLIRQMANELRGYSAATVIGSADINDAAKSLASALEVHERLNERVGEILRDLERDPAEPAPSAQSTEYAKTQ